MTASSPTLANSGWAIRPAPLCPIRDSRTARASSGPRHDGVRFHQRWPRGIPRHSASTANIEANGPGSPACNASVAWRSRSIMLAATTNLKATASDGRRCAVTTIGPCSVSRDAMASCSPRAKQVLRRDPRDACRGSASCRCRRACRWSRRRTRSRELACGASRSVRRAAIE